MKQAVSTALHLGARAVETATESVGHVGTRVRDRVLAAPGTRWVAYRGTSVAAYRWRSAAEAISLTLRACREALADVPHTVTQHPWELPVITVADLPAAQAALASTAGLPLYLDRDRPMPLTRAAVADGDRIFLAWASATGNFVAGPDVGVTLGTAPPPPPAPAVDVDLVFTWVDGADPDWLERRRGRRGDTTLHATAANDARFAQVEELRYSLRAVERFAPWRRRVFLVTDGQRPSWLAEEFPHVIPVHHSDIFDAPGALPTFNSHAIESRLNHIPGLAEHWVYLNDDVFLARYTPPSAFFTPDGRLLAFPADDRVPVDGPRAGEPVAVAARNNSVTLQRLTGERITHKLKHVPHPQLRSVTTELEQRAPDEFLRTELAPFRSPTDLSVASSLAPHYAVATGRGEVGALRHFYADVASPELRWRLPRLLEWRDADVICLNATSASPERARARLVAFLERYFA